MEPTEGFEPTTRCLQNSRSDQLSYVGAPPEFTKITDKIQRADYVIVCLNGARHPKAQRTDRIQQPDIDNFAHITRPGRRFFGIASRIHI